ncbi:hypothetical protein B0H15DRAFT_794749 [Mycena belliarum]|uniref:CxC2-like cysteine cluster KDZ transposase-associated domain-containing protein n=1 Tax=Mycena belliarum TaxID=1033014 RepID=A0AAD6XD75_9AGAR|nr:hypothetical protein B0H15DRAFT_794749 [Mycena belliae]
MNPWRRLIQRFLDEVVHHEGLGDAGDQSRCICCGSLYTKTTRRFRCQDCGVFVQCLDCVRRRHSLNPLHRLKEWNGTYWIKSTLAELNVVYQVGHGGHPCPRPHPTERSMVVMDVNAIHTVRYQYCGCDLSDSAQNLEQLLRNGWYPATTVDPGTCATFAVLDLFRLLSVVGNINAHDFVGTLERQTDACGLSEADIIQKDRYKAFGRMARQWAFLMRLKRAGCTHKPEGVAETKNGDTAVLCWTCPHDKINLPEGWREVSAEFRFLYMLLLAMDANFRLKNRLRANAHVDLPLGDGWGHLVEEPPYKEHLKGYVAEKDVSFFTCIAFAALLQKDTRMTAGLRCSGVGGVVCARHELVRPQGVGDLQKGERYSNMDYILLSSVLGIAALYLTISYDIACQWQVNLPHRMLAMPEHMRLNLEETTVMFGLPVWHAAAHERECQTQNSLSYQPGVGRTDGEGIERTWSVLNPLAWATKEMGAGGRHDAMEDRIDHHNFEKNINQGTTLPRKLVVAIDERDRQVSEFRDVDSTLTDEVRADWQARIDRWTNDRSKPNPFEIAGATNGPTEAAIRLLLTTEEAREASTGGRRLQGTSVTSFLVAGLQLEEAQQRIRKEAKGRTLLALDQSERVAEMRIAFFAKLRRFRNLQQVYMPAAVEALKREEERRDSELPPPKAEDVKLFLPSELPADVRAEGCKEGLPEMEGRLREGQCTDALCKLRTQLHSKRHMITFRDTNVVGQRKATRAYTLLERIGEGVDKMAAKYRRGRAALIALRGAEECSSWKELKPADIELDEEREGDAGARRKLGRIGSSKWRRNGPAISSKKKHLSWIWTAGGGPGVDEAALHDSVRVEWSKAKARKERWEEEVLLLREEMKRVLRFLRWRSGWWEVRRSMRQTNVSPELAAGLTAYAARQAALTREIARTFKRAWDTSVATAVRMAVLEDTVLAEGMAHFAELSAETNGEGST